MSFKETLQITQIQGPNLLATSLKSSFHTFSIVLYTVSVECISLSISHPKTQTQQTADHADRAD